jgi:hypothetical protein
VVGILHLVVGSFLSLSANFPGWDSVAKVLLFSEFLGPLQYASTVRTFFGNILVRVTYQNDSLSASSGLRIAQDKPGHGSLVGLAEGA